MGHDPEADLGRGMELLVRRIVHPAKGRITQVAEPK
jgi:hypothetical protein